jgi:hypothetical protein
MDPSGKTSDLGCVGCGFQDILDGNGQEEFEAANPLPESFVNGSRGMLATFITTGCDTVRRRPSRMLRSGSYHANPCGVVGAKYQPPFQQPFAMVAADKGY